MVAEGYLGIGAKMFSFPMASVDRFCNNANNTKRHVL